MKKKFLEEILIALSLANLLFITSWRQLLYPPSPAYNIKLAPASLDFVSVILCVIITGTIFWGGFQLSKLFHYKQTSIIVKLIFLAIFGMVLNGIRQQFLGQAGTIDVSLSIKIGIFAVLSVIVILALAILRNKIFDYICLCLLILSPFVLITFSQAVMGILSAKPIEDETSIASKLSAVKVNSERNIKARVIWVIFDELDYFIPFERQPPVANLPEFEKLRKESFFATNATSPTYETLSSLPSLITGKIVEHTEFEGKRELILSYQDKTITKFSKAPNIFSKVKSMNGNTAVIGWYHPYCEIIGQDLSACEWETNDFFSNFENKTLLESMSRNFLNCLISLPFGIRLYQGAQAETPNYVKRHFRMLEGAKLVVSNPNIDLALIHLPFPHPPSYYNKTTGRFGAPTTYFDNLIMTDQVLGEIRRSMEKAGLWENSVVIISSDHKWRVAANRNWLSKEEREITQETDHNQVPFFLKLSSRQSPVSYEKSFNTVITSDLILALIKGELTTSEDVKKWLDDNSDKLKE